jgi:hypothetical protein
MMPAMIFAISLLALLQFFVSYTRSLIAESREHELSEQTREICGFTAKTARADQFPRLLQLIELCPENSGDGFKVRAVTLYFRMLSLAHRLFRWLMVPSATGWIEVERGCCAYAAAVALDRRIAYNRTILAQQAGH